MTRPRSAGAGSPTGERGAGSGSPSERAPLASGESRCGPGARWWARRSRHGWGSGILPVGELTAELDREIPQLEPLGERRADPLLATSDRELRGVGPELAEHVAELEAHRLAVALEDLVSRGSRLRLAVVRPPHVL